MTAVSTSGNDVDSPPAKEVLDFDIRTGKATMSMALTVEQASQIASALIRIVSRANDNRRWYEEQIDRARS